MSNETTYALTSFIDNKTGADSYDIKKYYLTDNYALSVLVQTKTSGSQGGSCYGGHSSYFEISKDEITEDLTSEIIYRFNDLFKALSLDLTAMKDKAKETAESIYYDSSIGEATDNEYYGNYSLYKMYEVKTLDFLKDLLPKETFEIYEKLLNSHKKDSDLEFKIKELQENEQKYLLKLDGFENAKCKEQHDKEVSLQNAKNLVSTLTQELYSFEVDKLKAKNKLQEELKQIQSERKKLEGQEVVVGVINKKESFFYN